MRKFVVVAVSALAGAVLLLGCATPENPGSSERRTATGPRSEAEQGRQQHQQVLAEYNVLNDARVQAYVNDLGQRVARHCERPNLAWRFTVLDSAEVNAFSLPGGDVYLTRGLLAYLDNDADLVAVLGHEIAHVSARHSAPRATRAQLTEWSALTASVLDSAGTASAGELVQRLSQDAAVGYIARYSREQEAQADRLGAMCMARSGYNPRNLADVIRVLMDRERFAADQARAMPMQPRWLDSHPSSEQRLHDVTQWVERYSSSGWADNHRVGYLQSLNGLVFGDSREQGVVRGRNFYDERWDIALAAPPGWTIDRSLRALALLNAEGDAGLLVQALPPDTSIAPEDFLRSTLHAPVGAAQHITLNGLPAIRLVNEPMAAKDPSQPAQWTVVSGPGRRHYLLIPIARDAAARKRAHTSLRQAEASLRPMGAADRLEARPWTLRTVAYPHGGFAQLARQSPLPAYAEQRLRLLNGVYGGGEPVPGQLVKTVE